MSEVLKDLLFTIRQHPGFQEFLIAIEPPRRPHYRPSKVKDLQTIGAETAYASGALDQHDRWIALLTGASQETNSMKEKL